MGRLQATLHSGNPGEGEMKFVLLFVSKPLKKPLKILLY